MKIAETYSDPVSAVEEALEWIFRILFPNPSARSYFGLSGISQLISGNGWYLWFSNVEGVYSIELADADLCKTKFWKRLSNKENQIFLGTYRLKYFPHPEEYVFEFYSSLEKTMRSSYLFDETGTPKSVSCDKLHESLYSIGFMDLVTDTRRSFLELYFRSPDRWITMLEKEHEEETNHDNHPSIISPMAIDRCLKAWQLTWPLIDMLIKAISYVYETYPAFTAIFEKTGCVYSIHRDQRLTIEARNDITERSLGTLFQIEKDSFANKDTVIPPLTEYLRMRYQQSNTEKPMFVHFQKNPPNESIPWINPAWWCAKNFDISQKDVELIG